MTGLDFTALCDPQLRQLRPTRRRVLFLTLSIHRSASPFPGSASNTSAQLHNGGEVKPSVFNGPGSSAPRDIKPTAELGALDRWMIMLLTDSQTMPSPHADPANVDSS